MDSISHTVVVTPSYGTIMTGLSSGGNQGRIEICTTSVGYQPVKKDALVVILMEVGLVLYHNINLYSGSQRFTLFWCL